MSRPFFRILEPPDPWYQQPPEPERLQGEFKGRYPDISVCAAEECSDLIAVAAFYGHTTRPGPVAPSCLDFDDDEVRAAGGTLVKTDAVPPWPPEYNAAHHDIVHGHAEVAAAMVASLETEPARRRLLDRIEVLRTIFSLEARPDAPAAFQKAVKRRSRRLFREERALRETLALEFDRMPTHVRNLLGSERGDL